MQHTSAFLRLCEETQSRVREISVTEAANLAGSGHVLVDVREDREWVSGHAAGAEHLGKGVIERDVETRFPDPATPLMLYCGGGYRSLLAADTLQKMGYTNVVSVAGGFRSWVEAGLPIER